MRSLARRSYGRVCVVAALIATGTMFSSAPVSAAGNPFRCDPTPTFYRVSTQGDIGGVAAGDLNGDGLPDVVTANLGGTASVFINQGGGALAPGNRFSLGGALTADGAASPVLVDLNGDGKLDLVTANQYGDDVSVALGRGDGGFRPVKTFAAGTRPMSLVAGDFDGDGRVDLVTVNRHETDTGGDLHLLVGKGDGTFGPARDLEAPAGPASPLVAADFNGDGTLDLAYSLTVVNNNTVAVLLNRGDGSFFAPHTSTVGSGAFSLAVGRVNGDAFPDLVTGNVNDGTFSVLLNNADGTGTFAPAMPTAVAGGQLDVVLADVSGDGKADIVAGNPFNGNIWVLLNKGQGRFGSPVGCPVAPVGAPTRGPLHVTAADMNGDGKLDVITSNLGSGNNPPTISVLITP